jgi:ubiquitin carboxyl-terminal hydrolase L3
MKQCAINACGTIALIHSLFNCPDIKFVEGSFLAKKKIEWAGMGPEEIGKLFENSKELITEHKKAVEEGKTEIEDSTASHFIAFVNVQGVLLEFDGYKSQPVPHGHTTAETFAMDCVPVIKGFMERDPGAVNFSIMALAAAQ